MKVEVYRNLHQKCWSVRDCKTGKVVDHVQKIHLEDAELVVRPAGRAKVLREQRKNVHAYSMGTLNLDMFTMNEPQDRDGELLFHLPGAELRSGSFPHSGLGWGCHKSITNDKKHTTALVTMDKVPNWGLSSMARVAPDGQACLRCLEYTHSSSPG